MQQFRINVERHRLRRQLEIKANVRLLKAARRIKRSQPLDDVARINTLDLRSRHFAEIGEPADDRFQIRDLHSQGVRALVEDFVELGGTEVASAHQVLNRQLQRE